MVEKAKDYIKRYGIKGIIEKLLCKMFSILGFQISFWKLLVFNMEQCKDLHFEFQNFISLDISDFKQQSLYNPIWFTDEKTNAIETALRQEGNTAWGIFHNQLLICYGFISTSNMGTETVKLHESDAYFWDDYVHPDYRGKKLHQKLNAFRICKSKEIGKSRYLSIVGSFNRASLVGYRRLGFEIEQSFYRMKIFGKSEITTLDY